jgi:hypothetical protein
MGYRSEVMAAFYTTNKEDAPMLKLFIEENWPDKGLAPLECLKSDQYFGYLFHEEDVKWYDSFPEVQAFAEFVRKFTEIAQGGEADRRKWQYEFARIGEDYNDVEVTGTYYNDCVLSVSRAIMVNV